MSNDYNLSVEVVGGPALAAVLEGSSEFVKQALADALNKSAIKLMQKAKDNAPHKSGALEDSIHPELATPLNLEAKVGTTENIPYARAQEAGTIGMTIHSHSRSGTPFTYIGNIQPKWYMKNAKEEITPDMKEYLEEAGRSIVAHLAEGGV